LEASLFPWPPVGPGLVLGGFAGGLLELAVVVGASFPLPAPAPDLSGVVDC
jgi:hypothetical protein